MAKKDVEIVTSADLEQGDGNLIWEIIKTVGIFLIAIVFFRFYLFQPFLVKGSSMEPNFHEGEYLVVNELNYHLGSPKRGDVVVFKHPEPACSDFVNASYVNRVFLQGPCTNYIKRVIGLPGETVTVRDGNVYIKKKGSSTEEQLKESYIVENTPTLGNQTRTMGENEFFVLGDNRYPNASSDSREWGVLPRSHITGKAFILLYPFDKLGVVKSPSY